MRIKLLILTALLFLFGIRSVFAVTVTISNVPSTVSDQPFTFNVSVNGAQAGANYLRANFSQVGKTNYFGYTYNGHSFINSSTCIDYLAIIIDSSGNWNGTIQAKIDTSSSYYNGTGDYSFKVRRYTKSCSSSSYIWSNEIITKASISSPMPTPSATSSPIPSPTPITDTASSFTISNTPSQINSDQSFSVSINLSLPNNPNSSFYLKGAFKKSDSSNYFGLTKVVSSWIKNSSMHSNQFPITTDSSGNWSGSLDVKPDTEDSGFNGSGDYIFKVGRYSATGSGPAWSNESNINITLTAQTAEETTNTPTSESSQAFGIADPAPTNKPQVNLSKSAKSSKIDYPIASVAAATSLPTPSPKVEIKNQKQNNPFVWGGIFLVFAGVGSLGYIYWKKKKI